MKRLVLTLVFLLAPAVPAWADFNDGLRAYKRDDYAVAQESGKSGAKFQRLTDLMGRKLADRSSKWRCEITSQYVCNAKGCEQGQPTVWINVDFSANRYERCDIKGCDAYSMQTVVGGIYTTVALPKNGAFLRAVNDGSAFVEVTSLGRGTLSGFGQCFAR